MPRDWLDGPTPGRGGPKTSRLCLSCSRMFPSYGPQNRLCRKCTLKFRYAPLCGGGNAVIDGDEYGVLVLPDAK